jgi:sugar/nucleoside kinase (ribokinase family)
MYQSGIAPTTKDKITVTADHVRTLEVLTIGEALIDLISDQVVSSLADADGYQRFVGGQPTNVALNVVRLGGRAAVVACVGDDGFGSYICRQLDQAGVGTDYVYLTSQAPTTVAINARQTKTPDFIIHRGADAHILPEQGHLEAIKTSRVVHTSAFALSREPARSTILRSLKVAQQSGCMVSLDPNYHPHVWPDVADFHRVLADAYRWTDITKPSLDDCVRLFGPGLSPAAYVERFLDWGAEIVALTMGAQGVLLSTTEGVSAHIEPSDVAVSDVTGAGDAFWAGLLIGLLDGYAPDEAARLGQMVAELKIGTVGPLPQMPDRASLYRRLEAT